MRSRAEGAFRYLVAAVIAGYIKGTARDAELAADAFFPVDCHRAFLGAVQRAGSRADLHAARIAAVHAPAADEKPSDRVGLGGDLAVPDDVVGMSEPGPAGSDTSRSSSSARPKAGSSSCTLSGIRGIRCRAPVK